MFQEKQLRKLTLNLIDDRYSAKSSNLVVEELGLSFGDSRVDIAVINGKLIGFEIKSDFDNLKRLPQQIEMYQKYFDKISIITTSLHLDKVTNMLPSYWGIYIAKEINGRSQLKLVRSPQKNLLIDDVYLVRLLWKDEVLNLLANKGLKGIKSKTKDELYALMLENIPSSKVRTLVRTTLKSRTIWRPA